VTKRGDVVIATAPGAYGKPRPYLVVQSDRFDEHASVTVLPFTTDLHTAPLFRITVDPTLSNGLRVISQIAVDKAVTLPREKLTTPVGHLDAETMGRVVRALSVWLGIA
jgi:mRNA interferase MazF